jgi:transposase
VLFQLVLVKLSAVQKTVKLLWVAYLAFFVMGRKAWMFSQTANGAKASAVLYSIVETAKANGLTPYNYITYLLEQFSQPEQDLERLMPWNVNLG